MTVPNHSASSPNLAKLSLGTAPDSWGVWFPRDDHQVGWKQYLDEVALAGYLYTELGPQGFLPQDPGQLRDELAKRNLTVTGGTVFAGLHKGKEALDKAKEDFGREAALLREVGAEYLVHLPDQYTDMHGGALTEAAEIDPEIFGRIAFRHIANVDGHEQKEHAVAVDQAGLPASTIK